jgi:plasmid stabilization system protein ParE
MRIDWAGPARRDLQSIRDYVARDSAYYADRLVERIVGAVDNLSVFPELGRIVPEVARPDIRELLCGNYRVMYRLQTDRVLIVAVVHAARDWTQHEPKPWDMH